MSKIKIFSLGGLNENGKNMYVVDVDNDLFIFDAGLKYADDFMLGIDYIIPNFDYLKENESRIQGLFITHGHDEHMGAIPDILASMPNLKIYATTFTMEIIKKELELEGITKANLVEIKPHQKLIFNQNSIFPISLTHSIPDAVGYVLYTLDGAIFYTGNFVFDPTMIGNYKTDIGKLAYVGKQGVLCLLSESLYADRKGYTSPQHRVESNLVEIVNKYDNRILINIIQTEIYRIQELFNAVMKTNRRVVILGKQLEAIINKAIDTKYVNFDKSRLATISHVNDPSIIILVSDEKEKPFSNINRIARGYDKFIKLNAEDTVVFASPVYDGTEKTAAKLFDIIAQIGSNLIILPIKKHLDHHASSEDLMLMLDLMSPKYYFPVIGEYRHQVANAKVASKIGLPNENILVKLNGQVAEFVNGKLVETDEKIKIDDILIDGKATGNIGEAVLKDRQALSDNGIVIVTATLDKFTKKLLAGPEILTRGFIYVKDNADLIKEIEKISLEVINDNIKSGIVEHNKIKNGVRDKLGKYLFQETECNPMILVVMQEV
jgi:ribonuclease J